MLSVHEVFLSRRSNIMFCSYLILCNTLTNSQQQFQLHSKITFLRSIIFKMQKSNIIAIVPFYQVNLLHDNEKISPNLFNNFRSNFLNLHPTSCMIQYLMYHATRMQITCNLLIWKEPWSPYFFETKELKHLHILDSVHQGVDKTFRRASITFSVGERIWIKSRCALCNGRFATVGSAPHFPDRTSWTLYEMVTIDFRSTVSRLPGPWHRRHTHQR